MTDSVELRFSLVVPVFNEEDNVAPLLDEVVEVLTAHRPFEVVVVDDASRDATVERARAWQADHPDEHVRLIRMERNSGQSNAVLAGALGQFG